MKSLSSLSSGFDDVMRLFAMKLSLGQGQVLPLLLSHRRTGRGEIVRALRLEGPTRDGVVVRRHGAITAWSMRGLSRQCAAIRPTSRGTTAGTAEHPAWSVRPTLPARPYAPGRAPATGCVPRPGAAGDTLHTIFRHLNRTECEALVGVWADRVVGHLPRMALFITHFLPRNASCPQAGRKPHPFVSCEPFTKMVTRSSLESRGSRTTIIFSGSARGFRESSR